MRHIAMTAEPYLDSDYDGLPQNSPKMTARNPNLRPSPSPSHVITQVEPIFFAQSKVGTSTSADRVRPATTGKHLPSQADSVLLQYLGGNQHPDVAREAAMHALPSIDDADEDSPRGGVEVSLLQSSGDDLASLASNALKAAGLTNVANAAKNIRINDDDGKPNGTDNRPRDVNDAGKKDKENNDKTTPTTIPAPAPATASISPLIADITATAAAALNIADAHERRDPNPHHLSQPNGRVDEPSQAERQLTSPPGIHNSQLTPPQFAPLKPLGELAPIQPHSPKLDIHHHQSFTLPSISALHQYGDFNQKNDGARPEPHVPGDHRPPFSPQSPPRLPPLGGHSIASHTSPTPNSPNDYRRELPSPGRPNGGVNSNGQPYFFAHPRRPSQAEGPIVPYATPDTNGSSVNTPSTLNDLANHGPSPGAPLSLHAVATNIAAAAVDRMSIDGMVNHHVEGYKCTYPSCNAPPFQTQYLLNSHANVHSSNRPHYCSVKGCPRSEGGKGFKRKNEMIRHGLVHESPGYVCPFCVGDREHKYPRPDNLQRHVRVHHVDKNKDDPALREVLAQRPEGVHRGRRRRGIRIDEI